MPGDTGTPVEQPHLVRRFSLLPATALNMTNMIGVGPFITIPLLMMLWSWRTDRWPFGLEQAIS